MKFVIAYCLLFFYTIALLKPVLPMVKDAIAHVLWKADHLATVHNHYGINHADKEIEKAAHKEESNKFPGTTKTAEPVSIHLVLQNLYSFPILQTDNKIFGPLFPSIPSRALDKLYPPPKAC